MASMAASSKSNPAAAGGTRSTAVRVQKQRRWWSVSTVTIARAAIRAGAIGTVSGEVWRVRSVNVVWSHFAASSRVEYSLSICEAHSKVTSCKRGNFRMPGIAQVEGIQLRTLIRTPQEPNRQSRTGSLKKNWRLEAYVLWKDGSGLFLHIIQISSDISGARCIGTESAFEVENIRGMEGSGQVRPDPDRI
ncbi:hypothetical protein B0H14DRAFT_2623324 [Mycena olivaceomarginata]|nr:hypothetical protein B0H14DRAFT_2623324 [Mycena olivaceomarginata]